MRQMARIEINWTVFASAMHFFSLVNAACAHKDRDASHVAIGYWFQWKFRGVHEIVDDAAVVSYDESTVFFTSFVFIFCFTTRYSVLSNGFIIAVN